MWHVTSKALLAGQSPFWIEGEHCGHPALLRQEVALFYPPTVPLLLTGAPAHRLADWFSLLHFWLAGSAAFLFLRDAKCRIVPALFGGVAWMLSARMVQNALWPNAVAVSALLPLVLMGILRVGRRERRSGFLWTTLSAGLLLLAFRPQVLVGAGPLVLAVAVLSIVTSSERLATLRELLLAAAIAALLAAPALLPSAALLPASSRAGGLSAAERDVSRVTPAELERFLLPGSDTPPEGAAYPGIAVVVFFLAGIVLAIRRTEGLPRGLFAALAIGGAAGLVFAFGEVGPYRIISELPVLRSFRVPARYLASFSLALALAAALALDSLARRGRGSALALAGLVLVTIDLGLYARRRAPTAPVSLYESEPDVVPPLRARLGTDALGFPRRFLALAGIGLDPFAEGLRYLRSFDVAFGGGMRYGLESAQGQLGPGLRRTQELFAASAIGPRARAAELGGVGSVVTFWPSAGALARRDQFSFRDVSALPRAVLVPEAVGVPHERAIAVALSADFDPRTIAVLEDAETVPRGPRWDAAHTTLRLLRREPGWIELAAGLPDRGVLVVFESFEKGWRADVDGDAAAVSPADGAFLGVVLPAGEHRVRLRYVPPGLAAGLGLFAAGVLGVLLATMQMKRATP